MSSLVILTADIQAGSHIEAIAKSFEIRARLVAEPAVAREWLAMRTYDSLLVDARYGKDVPVEILTLAWKHNPYLSGGLFHPYGAVPQQWEARLLGAQVFSGSKMYEEIEVLLRNLPKPYMFDEHARRGILFVDDLDSPRDIICSFIESLGYANVRGAESAKQALDILCQSPDDFFCLLTDLRMPKMSGIELLRAVRSNPALSHLPVIALTAVSTSENFVDCLKEGITGFLVKPPQKKQLRQELEKARRIVVSGSSPRLCQPEEASHVKEALDRLRDRLFIE